MILVHVVQKMYKTCTEDAGFDSDLGCFFLFFVFVFKKMKRKLSPPPDKQNTRGILYRNTNTTG